jgi:hypothetical protein
MRMTPRSTVGLALAGALLMGATACGGSAAGKGAAAPTTTGGSGGASAPATTVAVPGLKADLVITGTRNATVKGTKGDCNISTSPDFGTGVSFTGADYPGLGSTGFLSIEGPHTNHFTDGSTVAAPGLVKFEIGGTGGLSGDTPNITVSADKKTITLDTDVEGTTGTVTIHENIKGTVTCS